MRLHLRARSSDSARATLRPGRDLPGLAGVELAAVMPLFVLIITGALLFARDLYLRLGLLTVANDCATALMHAPSGVGAAMQAADAVAGAYDLAGVYNGFPIGNYRFFNTCTAIAGSTQGNLFGELTYTVMQPGQRYKSDWEAP